MAIGLPRLGIMLDGNGEAYAQGTPLPRRFGMWTSANGVHLKRWIPTTTGANYEMSEQLAPLAPVREYMTVVTGTNMPTGKPGRPHCTTHTTLVTGVRNMGTSDANYTAATKSIDQVVADTIGKTTALRSLEVEVTHATAEEAGTAFHWWSHNGPNSPNICMRSCKDVFTRLFGMRPSSGSGADAGDVALRLRRSVLDAVASDAKDLDRQLGAVDRLRMQQHYEAIRAIETRLARATTTPRSPACRTPALPAISLVTSRREYDAEVELINKTMAELVGLALVCDLTRVFTFQLVHPGSELRVDTIIGRTNPGHHNMSHGPVDDIRLHKVVLHYMKELRVFIETLRSFPEGNGNLLDNCAIMAANDCGEGPTHAINDFPLLSFGRAGGLRTGIHYRAPSRENSLKLPLTLARAVGVPMAAFGVDELRATDSLSGIMS